ncbi:polysaccharide lyase-domain-containing protein [Fimicolochytrium jonesii]|uniref:polysaccharide lyase-domain-containing protein n=1 Tax=Fimicolochytrium jonesii TaxID=1396493 RepID=UPI0022FEDA59|nr:polysaccharide lyase-domain-containing protein [Fimicolochytrium jonesii]KAI8819154.1 polysaccharide lyase-domain-containing protein [Fimicolochytrium jonesii]
MKISLAVSLLGAFASLQPAFAKILWRGDFETSDINQWGVKENPGGPERFQIVTSPLRQGKYALRVETRQGDKYKTSSGNRNELSREDVIINKGEEEFYRWSVRFDENFPSPAGTWEVLAQWHSRYSAVPVGLALNGEKFEWLVGNEMDGPWPGTQVNAWNTPLKRGIWYDFIAHFKWSPEKNQASTSLWVNGAKVVDGIKAPNMYRGETNYLKAGLYRKDTIKPAGVIYHDGWMLADRLDDLLTDGYQITPYDPNHLQGGTSGNTTIPPTVPPTTPPTGDCTAAKTQFMACVNKCSRQL